MSQWWHLFLVRWRCRWPTTEWRRYADGTAKVQRFADCMAKLPRLKATDSFQKQSHEADHWQHRYLLWLTHWSVLTLRCSARSLETATLSKHHRTNQSQRQQQQQCLHSRTCSSLSVVRWNCVYPLTPQISTAGASVLVKNPKHLGKMLFRKPDQCFGTLHYTS